MKPPVLFLFLNETPRFSEVLKEPASLFFDSEIVKNWNRRILENQKRVSVVL
jgi:hypothetical protein